MANVTKTCVACSGSGLIEGNICGICIGTGVLPSKGMPRYIKETLDKIILAQGTQLEYLKKILEIIAKPTAVSKAAAVK
jgi:hypothetical protein